MNMSNAFSRMAFARSFASACGTVANAARTASLQSTPWTTASSTLRAHRLATSLIVSDGVGDSTSSRGDGTSLGRDPTLSSATTPISPRFGPWLGMMTASPNARLGSSGTSSPTRADHRSPVSIAFPAPARLTCERYSPVGDDMSANARLCGGTSGSGASATITVPSGDSAVCWALAAGNQSIA